MNQNDSRIERRFKRGCCSPISVVDAKAAKLLLSPHKTAENSYDSITNTSERSTETTCSRPPNMDELPWEQVKSGDLESLRVVLFSSSTSRRTRALSDLREKIGIARPSSVLRGPILTVCLVFSSLQGPIYRRMFASLS
jgi:hypothetical protein